jgi:hypothetical protein
MLLPRCFGHGWEFVSCFIICRCSGLAWWSPPCRLRHSLWVACTSLWVQTSNHPLAGIGRRSSAHSRHPKMLRRRKDLEAGRNDHQFKGSLDHLDRDRHRPSSPEGSGSNDVQTSSCVARALGSMAQLTVRHFTASVSHTGPVLPNGRVVDPDRSIWPGSSPFPRNALRNGFRTDKFCRDQSGTSPLLRDLLVNGVTSRHGLSVSGMKFVGPLSRMSDEQVPHALVIERAKRRNHVQPPVSQL